MESETTLVANGLESDDSLLLREYLEHGAQDAFREIYRRYQPFLFKKCLWGLRGNRELAAEAVQTVFVVLSRRASELVGNRQLGGWLSVVATYTIANMGRKEAFRQRHEVNAGATQERFSGDDGEKDGFDSVALSAVQAAIDQLPARQKSVVELRYFHKKEVAEIERSMNCSRRTVYNLLESAYTTIRLKLKREGITLSLAALVSALEVEAMELPVGDLSAGGLAKADYRLPIGENAEVSEGVRNTADAVMAEMDRAAVKTMWGWIGLGAAGLATIGVGTALVASHLHTAPVEPKTSWRIESVSGAVTVRRGDATLAAKTGDVLCLGDAILTSSSQEVQVVSEMGDRVLLREEGELKLGTGNAERGTDEEGRARASSPRRSSADLPLHLVRGAVVAQIKRLTRFTTQYAGIETDGAEFFLMLASGLMTNGLPWALTRTDVTDGLVHFTSSRIPNLESRIIDISSNQFAVAGTGCNGYAFAAVSGKSTGREMSPKYGGCFFREYAEFYDRERKSVGEVMASKKGRIVKEWTPRSFAEHAVLKGMQSPEIVESNGKTVARFRPLDGARPGSVMFSVGSESVPNSVLELDFSMEQSAGNGSPPSFGLRLAESRSFIPAGVSFVMPWTLKPMQLNVRSGEWGNLRVSRVVVGQHLGEWALNEIVMLGNGSVLRREWGFDPLQGVVVDLVNMTLSVAGARLYALE